MRRLLLVTSILLLIVVAVAACAQPTPEVVEVEKIVKETVVVEVEKEVEVPVEVEKVVEKVVEQTVVVEVPAEPVDKTVVEFWTTDNEEDRIGVYEAIAARYMAENPDIELRVVPIEEAGVSQRIATARAANRLPDIVRMGIERVATFAADGILDQDAAAAAIAAIGEDDFRDGPLNDGHRSQPPANTPPCPMMAGFRPSGIAMMCLKRLA